MRLVLACALALAATAVVTVQAVSQPSQEEVEAFEAWMKENKFPPSRVSLSRDPQQVAHGLGVVARKGQDSGTKMMSIPRRLCLTTHSLLETPIGDWLKENAAVFQPGSPAALQLALLYFKHGNGQGAESFWAPLINVIPKEFDTPHTWTKKEVRELRGTDVYRTVLEERREWNRDYTSFLDHLAGLEQHLPIDRITKSEYFWSRATVYGLATTLMTGDRAELALVPLLMQMKHHSNRATDIEYDDVTQRLIVTTINAVESGQELTYFRYYASNDIMLMDLGYTEGNSNPENHVDFDISRFVDEDDPFTAQRVHLLKKLSMYTQDTFTISREGMKQFLPAMRVLNMAPSDQAKIEKFMDPETEVVSVTNEFTTYSSILEQVDKQLSAYPTTLQQDLEILAQEDVPLRKQLAVKVRLDEKILLDELRETIEVARDKLKQFVKQQYEEGIPEPKPKVSALRLMTQEELREAEDWHFQERSKGGLNKASGEIE